MTSFVVPAGTTQTNRIDMQGSDTLTVQATGALSVSANAQAVRFDAPTSGALITNAGIIEAIGGQENPRAIRFEDGIGASLTATINNASSGIIRSRSDAVQIDGEAVAPSSGTLTITNSGSITSTDGQALDLAAAMGSFLADIENSGVIGSSNDDAIRIGGSGSVDNTGTINGGSAASYGGNVDGVQFEDNATGTVINGMGGTISGDRHGINAGIGTSIEVTNGAGSAITGRNGAGVGSDGSGTVTNFGTITGTFSNSPGSDINGPGGAPDGINDGDGDGIDIDGLATIVNRGTIQGTGAGGSGSDGLPNTSEGIAAGGGTITNHSGATIRGVGLGILIDDSSQGPAPFRTIIRNNGLIEGTSSIGIKIVSNSDDLIVNNGTIEGGGGTAIQFGNGDDALRIGTASVINGVSNGGGGDHNKLDYSTIGAAGATVNLAAGTATGTGGVSSFQDVVGSTGNDVFTGTGGANFLTGAGGNDRLAGGAGADRLDGGAGADVLAGGTGRDLLTGGAQGDRFVFSRASESPATAGRDVILDFVQGEDRIDLRGIDADGVAGNGDQAFTFRGTSGFSGAGGELRYAQVAGGDTLISGDVDGDRVADFQILMDGLFTLSATPGGDFLL